MRFMVIMYPGPAAEAGVLPDEKILTAMGQFNEELASKGMLLAGEGLQPTSKGARIRFSGGAATVTDGPFAEAKEVVGGYWMIQAPSKEAVVEQFRRCPANVDDFIEIRQVYEAEDFGPALTPELREAESRLRDATAR
ncbi:MAG TPA: YciI family protein [Chthonomonadaceae bacterium]|nr:YciI family protein [Chthonomonadaceae bacterium]